MKGGELEVIKTLVDSRQCYSLILARTPRLTEPKAFPNWESRKTVPQGEVSLHNLTNLSYDQHALPGSNSLDARYLTRPSGS